MPNRTVADPRLVVKETTPGTWLVHEPGQRPVDGVAVWLYSFGLMCEKHGSGGCGHLKAVQEAGAL